MKSGSNILPLNIMNELVLYKCTEQASSMGTVLQFLNGGCDWFKSHTLMH